MNEKYLRENQKIILQKALKILERQKYVYIVAQPRTGKTRSALAIISSLKPARALIVTKCKAIAGWLSEIKATDFKDLDIINYESMHKIDFKPDLIVFDECHHAISSFPLPSRAFRLAYELSVGSRYNIALSATPSAEGGSKLFHQFKILGKDNWQGDFYAWHSRYGVPSFVYIAGGEKKPCYKKVNQDLIDSSINDSIVSMSQAEAMPSFVKSQDRLIRLNAPKIVNSLIAQIEEGVICHKNKEILVESGAGALIKEHQILGGTILHTIHKLENCDAKEIKTPLGISSYKARYIRDNYKRKSVVLCNYIAERKLLSHVLKNSTESVDDFKEKDIQYFIGNVKAYSEGVDFSFADDMIIYSMTWSATAYQQVKDRMCNLNRKKEIFVDFLIGGKVDEMIYKAVAIDKLNFTMSYYKK